MRARRRGGREGRWDHHHGPAALVAGGWRRPLRLGGWRWVDVDGRVVRLIWLWTAAAGRFGARFFSGAGPASESRAVGRGRRGSCRLLPLGRPGSLRPGGCWRRGRAIGCLWFHPLPGLGPPAGEGRGVGDGGGAWAAAAWCGWASTGWCSAGWRRVGVDGNVVRMLWLQTADTGRVGARLIAGAGPAARCHARRRGAGEGDVGRGAAFSCRAADRARRGGCGLGGCMEQTGRCNRVSVVPSERGRVREGGLRRWFPGRAGRESGGRGSGTGERGRGRRRGREGGLRRGLSGPCRAGSGGRGSGAWSGAGKAALGGATERGDFRAVPS